MTNSDASMLRLCFQQAEESGFTRFEIDDPLSKRQFLSARAIIEMASGCRILSREHGQGCVSIQFDGERRARRAAAIYVLYRISLDPSHQHRFRSGLSFQRDLLDQSLARAIYLPPKYSLRAVREAFFKKRSGDAQALIYATSKEIGVLVDTTSLDAERKILLLAAQPAQREAMFRWIIAVANGTLPPQDRQDVGTIETAQAARPPAPASPSLSTLLARRTLKTLMDMGFDAARSRSTVEALPDKGDIDAAMAKLLDDSYVQAALTPIVAASTEDSSSDPASEGDLSDTATQLSLGDAFSVSSSPGSRCRTTSLSLGRSLSTDDGVPASPATRSTPALGMVPAESMAAGPDVGLGAAAGASASKSSARNQKKREKARAKKATGQVLVDPELAGPQQAGPVLVDAFPGHVEDSLEEPPEDFMCPISQELMEDPVCAADGHTYERRQIERWVALGKRTSPKSGGDLETTALFPNHLLRRQIREWQEARPCVHVG